MVKEAEAFSPAPTREEYMTTTEKQFDAHLVQNGDEVVYARLKKDGEHITAVCYLRTKDGRQVGIAIVAGLPQFTTEVMAYVNEEWVKYKTVRIAKQIAIAAGLSGEVTELEGSISTTHRVLIGPPPA